MKIKDIFVNAFTVYKKNFGKLFLPLLVMQLVILLPLLFFTMPGTVNMARALLKTLSSFSQTGTGMSSVLYVFAFILLVLLFFSPLIVSNTVYVVDKDYDQKAVTLKESLGFARHNYGSMIKSYFAALVTATPVFFYIIFVVSQVYMSQFDIALMDGLDWFLIITAIAAFLLFLLGTIFVPYVVVSEKKSGFTALFTSFRYLYKGNFLSTLGRLALAAGMVGALMFVVNWLSQLPFAELFDLYLENPAAALQEPLMVFAIILALLAIFLVALIMPFWYAFSYNTYRGAKLEYEEKHGKIEDINA